MDYLNKAMEDIKRNLQYAQKKAWMLQTIKDNHLQVLNAKNLYPVVSRANTAWNKAININTFPNFNFNFNIVEIADNQTYTITHEIRDVAISTWDDLRRYEINFYNNLIMPFMIVDGRVGFNFKGWEFAMLEINSSIIRYQRQIDNFEVNSQEFLKLCEQIQNFNKNREYTGLKFHLDYNYHGSY